MATTIRQTITETSPATPSTVVGVQVLTGLDDALSLKILATLTGATGGVLDVFLQGFDGVNWFDVCHFAQLGAGAAAAIFAVSLHRDQPSGVPAVIGFDGTPLLAVNTVSQGGFSDRLRMVFIAGASTTVGASQVITALKTIEL